MLFVIGVVLTGRFISRPSCFTAAGGLWALHAWLFYLLGLVLFTYVHDEISEEVKVKLTFVLSVVLAIVCTGLAELRESMALTAEFKRSQDESFDKVRPAPMTSMEMTTMKASSKEKTGNVIGNSRWMSNEDSVQMTTEQQQMLG